MPVHDPLVAVGGSQPSGYFLPASLIRVSRAGPGATSNVLLGSNLTEPMSSIQF